MPAKQTEESKTADAPVEAEGSTIKPQGENVSLPAGTSRPPGDLRRRASKQKRSGPFVKYVGSAALRSIAPSAWKTLNIELKDDSATHVWSVRNDKMVEAETFSDAQLDYLLIDDLQQGSGAHAFLLMDYDKDGQLVQVEYA